MLPMDLEVFPDAVIAERDVGPEAKEQLVLMDHLWIEMNILLIEKNPLLLIERKAFISPDICGFEGIFM